MWWRQFFITHLYGAVNAKHSRWAKANLDAVGSWEAATGHSAARRQGQLILKELNSQRMAKSDVASVCCGSVNTLNLCGVIS